VTGVTDNLKRDFVTAAWNGMMDELRETLDLHPDAARWKNQFGATGLRNAVAHGTHKMEVAKLLVAHGADVDAQDNDGLTPLMHAADSGGGPEAATRINDYIPWLLGLGADARLQDGQGRTAAQIAKAKGNEAAAEMIAAAQARQEEDAASPHAGIVRDLRIRRPLRLKS
jgi:uncharacterized protein